MIKACIFDLDGTLAYTLDSMAVVGNEVVRKYGLKPMPIENYRYYCGNGADMLVKRLLVDAGDPELLHYEEARALYRKEFDKALSGNAGNLKRVEKKRREAGGVLK